MSLKIVRNDITKMNTQAIVNTANDHVTVGTGCDSAVYKAAGYEELLSYRKEHIGEVPEGEAFLTPGFHLKAEYIIHAVSPLYQGGDQGEEEKLRSCYRNSLKLAKVHQIRSVAFPLISTGGFGYPKEEGMRIAIDEINAFLLGNDMDIYLVVFDEHTTALGGKLYPGLEEYIDQNYVEEKHEEEYGGDYRPSANLRRDREPVRGSQLDHALIRENRREDELDFRNRSDREPMRENRTQDELDRSSRSDRKWKSERPKFFHNLIAGASQKKGEAVRPKADEEIFGMPLEAGPAPSYDAKDDMMSLSKTDESEAPFIDFEEEHESKLEERMRHLSDTFSQYLMYLIQSKHMVNSDVYKRAIVDKKIFSKIKNNENYHPQKLTALCLCVGAKLNLDESRDLLARAGYALSPCDKTDIIFSYFIENEIYDMIELDIQLEEHGLPCIIS